MSSHSARAVMADVFAFLVAETGRPRVDQQPLGLESGHSSHEIPPWVPTPFRKACQPTSPTFCGVRDMSPEGFGPGSFG